MQYFLKLRELNMSSKVEKDLGLVLTNLMIAENITINDIAKMSLAKEVGVLRPKMSSR